VEGLEEIGRWISENESLFSGLAAIVALIAIVPAALRPLLKRKRSTPRPGSTSASSTHRSETQRARPRLAVLPFEAKADEDDLLTAAEIITEDLSAMLARSSGCEVISRVSSMAFARRGGTIAEASGELDVQYVVEGRLRAAQDRLRVSANLIDTQRDRVLWSEDFESERDEASAVARPLAERVASHLGIELTRAEVGRSRLRPRSRAARDHLLAAQGVLFDEGHNRASYERAIALLERAIDADPSDAEAYGLLALLVALGKIFGFVDQSDATRAQAFDACRRAMELDDRSSIVLGYVGCAYCDLRESERGIPLLERAIEVNPSNAQARAALGTALIGSARATDGVAQLEHALQITPAYKGIAPWATVLATGYIRLGRLDEASASIDRALRYDPSFFPAYLAAVVVALAKGDRDTAERNAKEAKRINPDLDERAVSNLMGRSAVAAMSQWVDLRGRSIEAGGSSTSSSG